MPVFFYVDPEMVADHNCRCVWQRVGLRRGCGVWLWLSGSCLAPSCVAGVHCALRAAVCGVCCLGCSLAC